MGLIGCALSLELVAARRRRFGAASLPLRRAIGVVLLGATAFAAISVVMPDDATAARAICLGAMVTGLLILRIKQDPVNTESLEPFIGKPVTVVCLEDTIGPARHLTLEGTLTGIDRSHLMLVGSTPPLPGRFRSLGKIDGTAEIALYDIVEVVCGEQGRSTFLVVRAPAHGCRSGKYVLRAGGARSRHGWTPAASNPPPPVLHEETRVLFLGAGGRRSRFSGQRAHRLGRPTVTTRSRPPPHAP